MCRDYQDTASYNVVCAKRQHTPGAQLECLQKLEIRSKTWRRLSLFLEPGMSLERFYNETKICVFKNKYFLLSSDCTSIEGVSVAAAA